jgi:hypothetical protein
MSRMRVEWVLLSILSWAARAGAEVPVQQHVGTVAVPATGRLSAAIFDAAGNPVRTLLQAKPVTVGERQDLFWDYRDESFVRVPAWRGPFEWRALVSNVVVTDEGSIGNTGLPGLWNMENHPAYGATSAPNAVFAVATDSSDNLYTVSAFEENGRPLHKLAPDGTPIWRTAHKGVSVAVSSQFVFVSDEPAAAATGYDDQIFRLTTDGVATPPDAFIVVNASKPDPIPKDARPTLVQSRLWRPLHLAAFDNRLIVANYLAEAVEVYDATSGAPLSATLVDAPLGVAADNLGGIWVANSGDRVTHFDWNGTNYVAGTTITGLSDPDGVAFSRQCAVTCVDHLYVSQMGTSSIREFDVSGAPEFLRDIGHAAAAGPLSDDGFFFNVSASIAADSQGLLSVADSKNHRVQRFFADGTLFDSIHADHTAAPSVEVVDATHHRVLSGAFEYEVDLATAHTDWQGDGKWRYTHNWEPRDGAFCSKASVRRRLEVAPGLMRDFIFYLGGRYAGVAVYAVEPTGLRRAAIIGGAWPGYDDRDAPTGARYIWTDEDGDDTVEAEEIDFDVEPGTGGSGFPPYFAVDEAGNIVIAKLTNEYGTSDVTRLNLTQFEQATSSSDALNPIYSWSPEPELGFRETLVPGSREFWRELGTFQLDVGSSTYVEFSNLGADFTVSADAIRLVDELGAETILDTQDAGSGTPYVPGPPAATGSVSVTGNWASSSQNFSSPGNTYLHDSNTQGTPLKTLRFMPIVPHAGSYTIFHRQHPEPGRASNTQITIQSAGRRDTFRIDQRQDERGGGNRTSVALGPSGELLGLGTTLAASTLPLGSSNNGGTSVFSLAPGGQLLQAFTFPRNEVQEQVVADPVSSDYWYSGGKNDVNMWSADGLLVAHLQPGAPNGGISGWIDHAYAMSVAPGSSGDQRYVYAEEVFESKSIRYRVDGLGTIQRLSGPIGPADTATGRSQPVLVIDTEDPAGSHVTVRGLWGKGSNHGELGSNYWHDGGGLKGQKFVTFTPLIKDPGRYRVSIRRFSHPVYDANVPVTVHHVDGDTLVPVNQQQTGTPWLELGTWAFREGMSGSITVSNAGTTGNVAADAIMVELVQSFVSDSEDSTGVTVTGAWGASNGIQGFHGANYRHDSNALKGSKSVTFAPLLPDARSYDVYARWTQHINRASNVPYDVLSLAGLTTLVFDQQANGSIWNRLGTYDFAAGSSGTVTIRNAGTNGVVVADAVKFEPTLTVVAESEGVVVVPGSFTPPDCSTSATSRVLGNWTTSMAVSGYHGASYLSDGNAASQKGAKRVCFKASLVESRNYAVYLRWTASSNRASNVPVDIRHATGTTRVVVDQRVNGAQWNYLGSFPLTNDEASFIEILNEGTDGAVIADAVLLR